MAGDRPFEDLASGLFCDVGLDVFFCAKKVYKVM